jgi:acyl carrier protein
VNAVTLTVTDIDVIAIIAGVLKMEVSQLTLDSSMFNTPYWDSLAHMSIITAIEAAFGGQFSIDEIASAISVQHLCDLAAKRSRSC